MGDSSKVEIITVWGKLFVLLGLSIFGLAAWDPGPLHTSVESRGLGTAIVGAATIFMAYEGFQLLSYDYEDIRHPSRTLPRATLTAVGAVILIYIMVTFGSVMLVGAEVLIEQKEVALSVAGKQALGITGLILVTVAAAFSTGSAINATMFSTARLMETVARKRKLPRFFARENEARIPYYAILVIGGLAAVLSTIGSLNALVDAASLIFLITFGTVNLIGFIKKIRFRIISLLGAVACLVAMLFSVYVQFKEQPVPLFVMLGLIAFALFARPLILKKTVHSKKEEDAD